MKTKFNIIAIAVLTLPLYFSCTNSAENATATAEPVKTEELSTFINGLAPVDVYLNLEKTGFTTDKNLSDAGNLWTCKLNEQNINYVVTTYSTNTTNVSSVTATAMVEAGSKDIAATEQFFKFICSLPYDGSAPDQAAQWLSANFNNDKATTTIGDAKFTINAPSAAARTLSIEKQK